MHAPDEPEPAEIEALATLADHALPPDAPGAWIRDAIARKLRDDDDESDDAS